MLRTHMCNTQTTCSCPRYSLLQNPDPIQADFFYTYFFQLYLMRGLLGRFLALVSWAGPRQATEQSVGVRPTARAFLPLFRAVPSFRALGGGCAIHLYGLAPSLPTNPKGAAPP
jgi:hypothetical protein